MIKRVVVENFRSLEKFTMECEPLTVLVGPNGSGKSSILDAIDRVLGLRYPSIASFEIPHDFTKFDDARDLVIRTRFAEPLSFVDALQQDHKVHGFELSLKPYKRSGKHGEKGELHSDYSPLNNAGEPLTVAKKLLKGTAQQKGGPVWEQLRISNDLRRQVQCLYIDQRRSVAQHGPWARGSILARLLGPARRELSTTKLPSGQTAQEAFSEKYQEAMEVLQTPRVRQIEKTISETASHALGFLGSKALGQLDVGFGFADPTNPYGTLRIVCSEGGLVLPAERLGSGVQSAIVVGIFEAFRELNEKIGTVLIEEPEMYLHPQAQRYFARLLSDLVDSGKCQVIYSTHSPIFADVGRFESIRVVGRSDFELTSQKSVSDPADVKFLESQRASKKLVGFSSSARSEIFFARKVLLVEGPSDSLAAQAFAMATGLDVDAEQLAIVPCGSKSAIPFMARVCRAFGIDVVALHDEDIYDESDGDDDRVRKIRESNEQQRALNALIVEAVGDSDSVHLAKPSLEGVLGISRNAADKPRRVAEALDALNVSNWPTAVASAVNQLRPHPNQDDKS